MLQTARFLAALCLPVCGLQAQTALRVATFNVEDVRTVDLLDGNTPRVRRLAEVIQRLRPNVILINEIAYDMPGAPGVPGGQPSGRNAERFIDYYLNVPQTDDLATAPLPKYRAFMAPTNTGVPSGFDLDNDGKITNSFPLVPAGATPTDEQVAAGRAYGGDCWGFGTFPGQYGMALLVDERLTIVADEARTFQKLPWSYMDGAYLPANADGAPWYSEEEQRYLRLSSKSHWDVPVRLPGDVVVHFLCSHPTPPAFDGAEQRNQKRNHDEIRFWADYVNDTGGYIVDDAGREGGLGRTESFVILGDLNADPARGSSFKNPITRLLGSVKRLDLSFIPLRDTPAAGSVPAPAGGPGLVPTATEPGKKDPAAPDPALTVTSSFGLRVDYVLPSTDLKVRRGGVWTALPSGVSTFPSDHQPVWLEVQVGH